MEGLEKKVLSGEEFCKINNNNKNKMKTSQYNILQYDLI